MMIRQNDITVEMHQQMQSFRVEKAPDILQPGVIVTKYGITQFIKQLQYIADQMTEIK